jgi:hypothetical protein
MSQYGNHGSPPHIATQSGRTSSSPFFALVKAWAAALIVLALTSYLQVTYIYGTFATNERLDSFGGVLLLIHLPNTVCIALGVWAAARIHPEPYRESPVRHLTATLAVPVAVQLLTYATTLSSPWRSMSVTGVFMSIAVLAVGCTIGFAADRLRRWEH